MKYISVLVVFILTLYSCKIAEDLTISRMEKTNSTIKLNGFYYYNNSIGYEIFFLYRNGVYRYFGICDCENLSEVISHISNETILKNTAILQYCWGIFNINPQLNIERWVSGTGGPYPTQLLLGKILNDTTLLMSEYPIGYLPKQNQVARKEDIFHFHHYAPKPDSTNVFIK